jgi:hypothetical protein
MPLKAVAQKQNARNNMNEYHENKPSSLEFALDQRHEKKVKSYPHQYVDSLMQPQFSSHHFLESATV